MATTTKSKAKKKTTKKPVKRAQAKSSTKATKSVKVSKKSAELKVEKSSKGSKSVTKQLNRLNLFSGVLGLLLAGAAGYLMNNYSVQIFTGLLTKDELASKAGTVFVPAVHAVYDLQIRWALVGILLVGAVIPLMAATRQRKMYEESLAKKVMLPRWIDMAVVSSLMISVIALLSGVQDFITLKIVAALMIVTCVLGWFAEKENAKANATAWGNYVLSLVTGTLPWVVVAVYAVGTEVYGQVRSPWYVYALYASTLLAFLGYAGNQMRQLKLKQNYEVTEKNYLRISIFAKVAFAVILIVGLYKK